MATPTARSARALPKAFPAMMPCQACSCAGRTLQSVKAWRYECEPVGSVSGSTPGSAGSVGVAGSGGTAGVVGSAGSAGVPGSGWAGTTGASGTAGVTGSVG